MGWVQHAVVGRRLALFGDLGRREGDNIFKLCKEFLFNVLCWGKAMVAYRKPQQRRKEESERL